MIIRYDYEKDEDVQKILEGNSDKFLVEQFDGLYEKYLLFSDEPIIQEPTLEQVVQQQGNKISILEEENNNLKLELSITQEAVNELLFSTLNA